jgi:hypothetical protein
MKRTTWPKGKPIPRFASYADEVSFWHSHDFDEDADEKGWEEVARSEAIHLDGADVRALIKIAKRKRVSVKQVVEQFIRDGIRKAS